MDTTRGKTSLMAKGKACFSFQDNRFCSRPPWGDEAGPHPCPPPQPTVL